MPPYGVGAAEGSPDQDEDITVDHSVL